MGLFNRSIPVEPFAIAGLVGGAGVLGEATARFAKKFPSVLAVAAFNAEIPKKAATHYRSVLSQLASSSPQHKSDLDLFVFSSLTVNSAKLGDLDKALFEAAAISKGVKKEEVGRMYSEALQAAKEPGIALVRHYAKHPKKSFFGSIIEAILSAFGRKQPIKEDKRNGQM